METNFCDNILEIFKLVISDKAHFREEIAEKLGVNVRSVTKYLTYLRDKLNVDVKWRKKDKRYIVYDNGKFNNFIEQLNIKGER